MLLGRLMRCLTSVYGIFVLNLAYLLLGAWLFMAIEAPCEESIQNNLEEEREVLVESIIYFGKNLPEGYYGNASEKLAMYENTLANFYRKRATFKTASGNESLADMRLWTPYGAIIFCYSVITTIGWGNIVPTSLNGKLGTVIYGLNGMPLFFSLSNDVGTALNRLLFSTWNKTRRLIIPFFKKQNLSSKSRTKSSKSSSKKKSREKTKEAETDKGNDASKNQSHNRSLRVNKNQSQNSSPRIDNSRQGLNGLPANQTTDSRQQVQAHSRYLSSLQSCVDFMLYAQEETRAGRTPRHQPHFTITSRQDALLLWQVLARLPARQARTCMEYLGLDTRRSTTEASTRFTTQTDVPVEDTGPSTQTYLPNLGGDTQETKCWWNGQTGERQQCPVHPHDSRSEDSLQNNGAQTRQLGEDHEEDGGTFKQPGLSGRSWTLEGSGLFGQLGTPLGTASCEPASAFNQVGIPTSSNTGDSALLGAGQQNRAHQLRRQSVKVPEIVAPPYLPLQKHNCPYRDGPDQILKRGMDSEAAFTGINVRQQVAEPRLKLKSVNMRQQVVEHGPTSSHPMAELRTARASTSPGSPATPGCPKQVQIPEVGVTNHSEPEADILPHLTSDIVANVGKQRMDMFVSVVDGLLAAGSRNLVQSTSLSHNKTSLVNHKQINNLEPDGDITLGATHQIGNKMEPTRHQTSRVLVPRVGQDCVQLPQNMVRRAVQNPAQSNRNFNKKCNNNFNKNSNKNFNGSSSDQQDTESELEDISTVYSSGRLLFSDEEDEDEFISGVGMGFNPHMADMAGTMREGFFMGSLTDREITKVTEPWVEQEEPPLPITGFLTERMRMPMIILYSIMLFYVFFGTLVICLWGNDKLKDFWDSLYFTYVLLSTTGFGDLLPTPDMYTFIVVYAVIGMALYNVMINATLELFLEVIEYLGSIGNSPEDSDSKTDIKNDES